jgi:hypothetical protein
MSDFNQIRSFSADFHKPPLSVLMKISPVGAALICADRQTDRSVKLEKFSSGREPSQINHKIQRFGDQLLLHHQGDAISYPLMIGMELFSEMLCFIIRPTRLSARENSIDLCRHKNLKTDVTELIRASRC